MLDGYPAVHPSTCFLGCWTNSSPKKRIPVDFYCLAGKQLGYIRGRKSLTKSYNDHFNFWALYSVTDLHKRPVKEESGQAPHVQYVQLYSQVVKMSCTLIAFTALKNSLRSVCFGFLLKEWILQRLHLPKQYPDSLSHNSRLYGSILCFCGCHRGPLPVNTGVFLWVAEAI